MHDYRTNAFRVGSSNNLLKDNHHFSNVSGNQIDIDRNCKDNMNLMKNNQHNVDINGGIYHNNNKISATYLGNGKRCNFTDIGHSGIDRSSNMNTNYNYETNPSDSIITIDQDKGITGNNSLGNNLNSFNVPNGSSKTVYRGGISNGRNGYLLWIITPVAASFSVAIVIAALAGPQWLFTQEKLPMFYNRTSVYKLNDENAQKTKYTKSSLWILCSSTVQGTNSSTMEPYNCIKIDYFPREQYRADPQDSTLAIPYTIMRSAPFFLVSGIILIISFIVFLVATCSHQNSLYYFTSGIMFIVSGLLMLIGLIVYISIFKAEIGLKLRPKSTLQPPLFRFTYGQSFFLYVFGFVTTEFVGLLNIFLYISLQQVGHHKTIPCLTFINAPEKDKVMDTNNKKSLKPCEDEVSSFVCKKHSAMSDMVYVSDIDRRYYFEKPQKCDLHSKNIAKSLNQLYTEPAPIFSPFDLPQEFPLTRSVSTTTEIFSNNLSSNSIQQSLDKQNKKNQTNDSKESLNDICGLSRGILSKGLRRKSKDELFNEFCKKAGMRPKPKDIYYIDDDANIGPDEDSIFIVDNYSTLTKNRRNSLMEPRKKNSNTSLAPIDKVYPKSLFDLDRYDPNAWSSTNQYFLKNKTNDNHLYHSRTLPRCYMKRNFDSRDHILLNHRFSLGSKDTFNSNDLLHKSCDDISSTNLGSQKLNNLTIQWPTAIPTSPSSFSTKSAFYHSSNDHGVYPVRHKFTRGYAYEEKSQDSFDTFDLDQMERERRKSHANLFEATMGYDCINGTAV